MEAPRVARLGLLHLLDLVEEFELEDDPDISRRTSVSDKNNINLMGSLLPYNLYLGNQLLLVLFGFPKDFRTSVMYNLFGSLSLKRYQDWI